ncbi:MAG: hydrogenase small subunit [Campylobacterales bacterium]|nr:hydrogenase small subunit [Campylobacterales bacterium]
MRVIIIGGGISSVYLANNLLKQSNKIQVLILSNESVKPYDRIHLCRLIDQTASLEEISLPIDPMVQIQLQQCIESIDPVSKKVYTQNGAFVYDKLIIATGSIPKIDNRFKQFHNVSGFRNATDCKNIRESLLNHHLVLVGSGPIALELLETLCGIQAIQKITLLVRSKHLYDKNLSIDSIKTIESSYLSNGRVHISYEDEIVDFESEYSAIVKLMTKKLTIENPYIVFGIGIEPSLDQFCKIVSIDKGILVNQYLQTSIEDIYAVGECAQVQVDDVNFIAGHVKDCTNQADVAITHILDQNSDMKFSVSTNIDMLKVGSFDLVEVSGLGYKNSTDNKIEKVIIANKNENRIDEYFISNKKLLRFIGINSNIDVGYLEQLIDSKEDVDFNYLYENRVVGLRGRLVCSCEHTYYQDIVDLVTQTGCDSFASFATFSNAGRVCGRCKMMVHDIINDSQKLIDPNMPHKTLQDIQLEKQLLEVSNRIDKYNKLHPANNISSQSLDLALESIDNAKQELNHWVSMVTASMQLHPSFEPLVQKGIHQINKVPVIWLELADCSGNSEAFIKSVNPSIEDLLFDYISLDYHELLMNDSGDCSENQLDQLIGNKEQKYILIVEGAIPLGLDGKFLRIGSKGETGLEVLQKCATNAALILAVGSCALDGGVVAAAPNPTNAVGVAQALNRSDIINLPGCPVNPVNIVGTLLSYIMFDELPKLDKYNRPLWAYEGRIHDNCERRGHYELGEFVKEWGDEGAKKGWCLFEMGCKGPYANANCPTMKFNGGSSWPVQVGHGCMGCTEVGFFDKFANERKVVVET